VASNLLHIFNITIQLQELWRQVAASCLWWELLQTCLGCPQICSTTHLSPCFQITTLPAVLFCLVTAWARAVAHGVICPLQLCPRPRGAPLPEGHLAPWKSPVSKWDWCLCQSLWLNSGLKHQRCFKKTGVVSELLGCSRRFGAVAVPPFLLAEEPCCLVGPVWTWIGSSHAWPP